MSHNTYPLRVRLTAAALSAVGYLSLGGCSVENPAPNNVSQPLAPTAPVEASITQSPVITDPMLKAQKDFKDTATATGLRILGDIANQKSHSDSYADSYQGNGRYATTNPDVTSIPAMSVWYLANEKQITMTTSVKTNSNQFDSETMQFDVTGATATRFNSEIAAHRPLTATDYMDALTSPDVAVYSVSLIDNQDVHHEITLANTSPGALSVTRFDGTETNNLLDPTNVDLFVPGFDRRMIAIEDALSSHL
jgi:hypothetical protein